LNVFQLPESKSHWKTEKEIKDRIVELICADGADGRGEK
jgi:hypothetical protein